jgi:hypothetical protein
MRGHLILVIGVAGLGLAGCRRTAREPEAPRRPAGRTVFTDSALHAERCEPVQPGEDWRRVCTPRDQGVRLVKPPEPPPERPPERP